MSHNNIIDLQEQDQQLLTSLLDGRKRKGDGNVIVLATNVEALILED